MRRGVNHEEIRESSADGDCAALPKEMKLLN
jgi:hypothetical protein